MLSTRFPCGTFSSRYNTRLLCRLLAAPDAPFGPPLKPPSRPVPLSSVFRPRSRSQYAVDVAIAAVTFVVVLLTAPWAAKHIAHDPEAVGLIVVYAAALVPNALVGTASATLTTLGHFSLIAKINTLTTFLRMAVVLGFVSTGWQLSGVVWGNVIATVVSGLLYGTCAGLTTRRVWGASPFQGSWQALRGRRREISGLFVVNDLNVLLDMIPKYTDIIILGYFRGPTETGYYKLAKNLAGGLSNLARPLQSVIYPKFARLWSTGLLEDFRRALYNCVVTIGIFLSSIVLLSILIIPSLIFYILDASYSAASLAVQILLLVTGIRLVSFWIRPLYLVIGKIHILTTFALVGAIVSIPAYVGFVWFWGFQGLAISRAGLAIITDVTAGILGILFIINNNRVQYRSDNRIIVRGSKKYFDFSTLRSRPEVHVASPRPGHPLPPRFQSPETVLIAPASRPGQDSSMVVSHS